MRTICRLFVVGFALVLAGCLETMPKLSGANDLPASPTLKDRNAAVAQAWDRASLDCRAQYKPRGTFCEQLRTEGEFLSCSAEGFAKSAQAFKYPSPDKIWVWHNCVQTTANLLRDGFFLSKREIEKRMSDCQAKLDTEPEFPVRQTGFFSPLIAMVTFGVNQSQVALPTCAARFAPQQQPVAEVKPTTVSIPIQPTAPIAVQQPPPEPVELSKPSKQIVKSKPRNTVSTADVKSTGSSNLGRSGSGSGSNVSPEMKGACPIPGACGPSVPPDAVKRP